MSSSPQPQAIISAPPRSRTPVGPRGKVPATHTPVPQPSILAPQPSQTSPTSGHIGPGHAAFQIIPSRTSDPDQTEETLQAAMQGLVLDVRRPVALEIAGIGATGTKQFLVRATDLGALEHAKAHIRAYAPQVSVRHLAQTDPFVAYPGETVSASELQPGAASYLPMRDMEETDPIRGILASLTLPPDMRAVAQIALVPAMPAWSRNHLRKSVEHPLEKERQRHRDALVLAKLGAPSLAGLLFLCMVLAGLLLYSRFPTLLPEWFLRACTHLFFYGQAPHFSATQAILFYGGLASLFLVPVFLMMIVDLLKKHVSGGPLYDQLQVARKTGQMAYRTRIRLYVFGPGPWRSLWQVWWRYSGLLCWSLMRQSRRGIRLFLIGIRWLLRKGDTPTQRIKPTHPFKLFLRGRRHWKEEANWRQMQQQRRHEGLGCLAAAYRQFDTASTGYFVPKRLSDKKALQLVQEQWYQKVSSSHHFITADFLSRAWYLPKAAMFDLPGIEQKRARTLLIPTCLIAPPSRRAIGTSRHAGYAFPFALPPDFLRQHTLIGGKTGEGKSTLMIHMAREAMATGALCLIDPHGDLAHDVLRSIPLDRSDDVVFLDLGDKTYSVGLNPLDVILGRDRDLTVAALVETFKKVWESGWGTRMEAPFRAALMTLYEANEILVQQGKANQQYTLLDVVQILLDESFCHALLSSVHDIYLHRFWYQYFDPLDARQQRERIDPVITKMAQFESRVARRILGQSRSTINLSEFVAQRKIIIIRLAISEAGLAAPILGATLLGLLMVALREQSVLPPEERVGMSIIVDEFQSIPGADYALLLAELRKFGGAAVLATQSFEYLAKLSPHLQATTLANVKQYFMFRLSADDARLIARELSDVTQEDILNLDTHSCYVKLVHDQRQQPTFSLHIERPHLQKRDMVEVIRGRSRRYSRLAADVEQELFFAMARALQSTPREEQHGSTRQYKQRQQKGYAMKTAVVDAAIVDTPPSAAAASQSTTTQAKPGAVETSAPVETQQPQATEQPATSFRPGGTRHIRFHKRKKAAPSEDDLISSFDVHPDIEEDEAAEQEGDG